MPRHWNIAVIGAGTVGEWHIRIVPTLPDCTLVAVCDILPDKAHLALQRNNLQHVPVYADESEMFRKEKIDAVHVCTPSGEHRAPADLALKNGKFVVVEKPMEIKTDRIDAMIDLASRQGVRIAGIFQNRWNPANRAIKSAVDEGRFGRLAWAGSFTPWYRPDNYYSDVKWRGTWALDGGGAVMNQGVHQVDLIQWILGPVKTVSAYAASRIHPQIETEDTLTCALQFASGVFGTFVSTTAMFPGGPTRLEIGGEHGSVISEDGLKRFEFRTPRPEDAELLEKFAPGKQAPSGGGKSVAVGLDLHWNNIQHIYNSWTQNKDADTAGPEARKSVAIVNAMYDSARKNGAPVDVK